MANVQVIKAVNTQKNISKNLNSPKLRVAAYCRVSTDHDEQIESYNTQMDYYKELINKKDEWTLVDIYADEAITGTKVDKREDFQRMINDCLCGEIDMIITKSISRFARNMLDVLKYVRILLDKNISIIFEEENINTSTMDGELLLVILSAVYQQEVENTSAHVKRGIRMRNERGDVSGFPACFGYDYDPEKKVLEINENEAKYVHYIYKRYLEGAGGFVIGHELEKMGIKTKRGSTRWCASTVIKLIGNVKYKGDLLLGKSYTVNPITKKRVLNMGEKDKYYIKDHHQPIISSDIFDEAQKIRVARNCIRKQQPEKVHAYEEKGIYSRKYAFSCKVKCGFCGKSLHRRTWHCGSKYGTKVWQCFTSTHRGTEFCPNSRGIYEETLEKAFVESYRLMCKNNKSVIDEFLEKVKETLSKCNFEKDLLKSEANSESIEKKISKLLDMRLEDLITEKVYEEKYQELHELLNSQKKTKAKILSMLKEKGTVLPRLKKFKHILENNAVLDKFDRNIFESVVEKIIVGGHDEKGNVDPRKIVFVYKTGLESSLDGEKFKLPRRNAKQNIDSHELKDKQKDNNNSQSNTDGILTSENAILCSNYSSDTGGCFGYYSPEE
jgi:Site-specific recombinases, DNA invertase Pin homologs